MLEIWKPVAGYEGLYEVSNLGRARSFYRGGRILRPCLDKDGYPLVALNRGGVRKTYVLHSLIARAFHGDKRNALHNEVAHLDNDRANCRADNLQWVSRTENQFHKRLHGTHQAGDLAGNRILTSAQVAIIRQRRTTGARLAERFGVSRGAIYDIWSGKTWKLAQRPPQ